MFCPNVLFYIRINCSWKYETRVDSFDSYIKAHLYYGKAWQHRHGCHGEICHMITCGGTATRLTVSVQHSLYRSVQLITPCKVTERFVKLWQLIILHGQLFFVFLNLFHDFSAVLFLLAGKAGPQLAAIGLESDDVTSDQHLARESYNTNCTTP